MTDIATLWDDDFAPVTSAIGFVRAPLVEVVTALAEWREMIHGAARSTSREGGLRENIQALEPLTGGVRPRELVVSTRNPEWAAVFDCGVQGGDPSTTVGHLSRAIGVQGVVVVSIPDVPESMGE
jgi:hypothetical protein